MSLHLFPGQPFSAQAIVARGIAGLALFAGAAFSSNAATVTGSAAIANDYVWRGSDRKSVV